MRKNADDNKKGSKAKEQPKAKVSAKAPAKATSKSGNPTKASLPSSDKKTGDKLNFRPRRPAETKEAFDSVYRFGSTNSIAPKAPPKDTPRGRAVSESMRKLRKTMFGSTAAIAAALAAVGYVPPTYAEAANVKVTDFSDMKSNQGTWYYSAMDWGLQRGVIAGYETDGVRVLKPDQTVTEAEFLAMLVRFFPNSKDTLESLNAKYKPEQWADNYYGAAKLYNIHVIGTSRTERRNQPITRGQVAQMIAGSFGKNLSVDAAVAYLYENGLTEGRGTAKTIESYDPNGLLNRAEAVAFLKKISDKTSGSLEMKTRSIRQEKTDDAVLAKYKTVSTPQPKPNTTTAASYPKPILTTPTKPVPPKVQQPVNKTFSFDQIKIPEYETLKKFANDNGLLIMKKDPSRGFIIGKDTKSAYEVYLNIKEKSILVDISGFKDKQLVSTAHKMMAMYNIPAHEYEKELEIFYTKVKTRTEYKHNGYLLDVSSIGGNGKFGYRITSDR